MRHRIEITLSDVFGAPPAWAPTPKVAFEDRDPVAATREATGLYGIEVPVGTSRFTITAPAVNEQSWPVEQAFTFAAGDPPRISHDGALGPYVYPPVFRSDGAAWVIGIQLRLSRLRECRAKVDATLGNVIYDTDAKNQPLRYRGMHFDLDVDVTSYLTAFPFLSGLPFDPDPKARRNLMLFREEKGAVGGELAFFECVRTPKLVVVWTPPGWRYPPRWAAQVPRATDYFLYIHPSPVWGPGPAGKLDKDYPWNYPSLDLASRYLMGNLRGLAPIEGMWWTTPFRSILPSLSKAGSKSVVVFPVGGPGYLGDVVTQAGAWRFLNEIDHALGRLSGSPTAASKVGKVTVAGFSFGAETVVSMMGADHPEFGKRWFEAVCLDLPTPNVAAARGFLEAHPGRRRFHTYAQHPGWLLLKDDIRKAPGPGPEFSERVARYDATISHSMPGGLDPATRQPVSKAVPKKVSVTATAARGPRGTIFHAPTDFWELVEDRFAQSDVGWRYWGLHFGYSAISLYDACLPTRNDLDRPFDAP